MPLQSLRLLFLTSVMAGVTFAQDLEDDRGVARLSLVQGDVTIQRGDVDDPITGATNAPLLAPDRVLTGRSSKAEIQFDWANLLRLSQDSEVRLTQIEDGRFAAEIARGVVTFRVLRDSNADVELSLPGLSVKPLGRGVYRIAVRESICEVTVRRGEADVYTIGGRERVREGQTLRARSESSPVDYSVVPEIAKDAWDIWNQARDQELERSQSYSFVSPDIYGAEDLDSYGEWQNDLDYGWSWTPAVDDSWAPYRNGRWSWIDWYGWSWVSQDVWGWAPYHYGRWYYRDRKGWSWSPGARNARHQWSPALVGFFSLGGGNIGWVPLAPSDQLNRWWGKRIYESYRRPDGLNRHSQFVEQFNGGQGYRNGAFRNAASSAQRSHFGSRDHVRPSSVDRDQMREVGAYRGALPFQPSRDSVRVAGREGRTLRSGPAKQFFFSRRSGASVDRVPFEEQRRSVQEFSRGESRRQAAPAPREAVEARSTEEPARAAEAEQRDTDRRDPDRRGGRDRQAARAPELSKSERVGGNSGPRGSAMREGARSGARAAESRRGGK